MRLLAIATAWLVIASAPVFLGTLAWAYILMFEIVPLWLWVVQVFSAIIVALGLATLLDTRHPLPSQQQDDQ